MDTSLERWRHHFRFSRIDPSEYLVIRRSDDELLGRVDRHGTWWAAYTVDRLRIDRIQYTSRRSAADALERHHQVHGQPVARTQETQPSRTEPACAIVRSCAPEPSPSEEGLRVSPHRPTDKSSVPPTYHALLLDAVERSSRSAREISISALGHESGVRSLQRGLDIRVSTLEALCSELGLHFEVRDNHIPPTFPVPEDQDLKNLLSEISRTYRGIATPTQRAVFLQLLTNINTTFDKGLIPNG